MNKRIIVFVLFNFNATVVIGQKILIEEQKEIVSTLAGESEIYKDFILKSRYTIKERKAVRLFLKEKIKNLSLEIKEHPYTFKNLDPEKSPEFFEGKNIYTILPATTNSKQYVILGAHFDSVKDCPGANDNATGVAMVYSVARKLQSIKKRDKNVIIVFFDQEELDLIGSRAFAQFIQKKNLDIHSVHTIDQMGWDKDGDRAIELELPTDVLKEKYIRQAQKLNIPVFVTDVGATDHQAFRELDFNAIGITEEYKNDDTTPFYHLSGDTYETVNFEYLASTTELVFRVFEDLIITKN